MISYTFSDDEVAEAGATILLTKNIFSAQGIELEDAFSKTDVLYNGMNCFTWDDGKDFTDEDNRLEFNKLLFDVRNSKILNPRIKQLWDTRE